MTSKSNKPPILYTPSYPWHKFDFIVNNHYWSHIEDKNLCQRIRVVNLKDLGYILDQFKIPFFLFGSTLKSAYEHQTLIPDHDDDIGTFIESKAIIEDKVLPVLISAGFQVIRNDPEMISIERNYRYIDICFLRSRLNKIGYNNKFVLKRYLQKFKTICVDNLELPAPLYTSSILQDLYPSSQIRKFFSGVQKKILFVFRNPCKIYQSIQAKYVKLLEKEELFARPFFESMSIVFGIKVSMLTLNDFLKLEIEPLDSFNWRWRANHLNLITDNQKHKRVGEIYTFISECYLKTDKSPDIIESDTSQLFSTPSNYDMRFWWSGNNYFWYCIKYQFRHEVVPYSLANEYITSIKNPMLYSADYYQSLTPMSNLSIQRFLIRHPIVLKGQAITSGKHRVFAQLGRLLDGKKYIHMKTIRILVN